MPSIKLNKEIVEFQLFENIYQDFSQYLVRIQVTLEVMIHELQILEEYALTTLYIVGLSFYIHYVVNNYIQFLVSY